MMKSTKYLVLRILLIIGVFGTLLFTFTQSLLPPTNSNEVSEGVRGFLSVIISPDTAFGAFVHENIRKIAHFAEYFLLGTFTSFYIVIFMPSITSMPKGRLRFVIYSFVAAPLVALFDETLQIFSGRGPAISDVWLDFSGFLTSAAVIYAVYYIISSIKKHKAEQQI